MAGCVNKLLCLVLSLIVLNTPAAAVHNGHHIFNSIHSSMRQWGSSLNHNGVSFFRASVPKDVQLYHGTWRSSRVEGMEWLAFEPEHAMNMAFIDHYLNESSVPEHVRSRSAKWWHRQAFTSNRPNTEPVQIILDRAPEPEPKPLPPIWSEPGWLHTYTPNRNLELLYIDGLSAGSCERGTIDSQDFVLLSNTSRENYPQDPMDEYTRARGLCHLAQHEFHGKIDGFIRMETGFEIILCDFALLDLVRIVRSARPLFPNPFQDGEMGFFFLRAITSRYTGIGGHRVNVDYDNFVTAFSHSEIDLWSSGGEQPRLKGISNTTASVLLDDIKRMVLSERRPISEQVDWQSIADMYINRYARPIRNLVSTNLRTAKSIRIEIHRLMEPYMHLTRPDRDATIKRCQQAFIPVHLIDTSNPSLSQQAVEQVAYDLCSYLHLVLTDQDELVVQKGHLQSLIGMLNWTAWKECQPACALDEICFAPIWPFGLQADHDKPTCLNSSAISGRYGYWGNDSGPLMVAAE